MVKKSDILTLPILSLLLLVTGCDSWKDESLAPSVSLLFTTNVRSGETSPLLEKVNARLHLAGTPPEEIIEKEILIDNNGQGTIEYLTERKWHISYWNTLPDKGQLYFDKNDNSINVLQTDNYLHDPAPFHAGVSDFDYIPDKIVYLKLKPQTGVLTIVLIWDNATGLPKTISGVLSGVASKRVFGAQEMTVSEQGIGCVPYLFTLSSSGIYPSLTYVASHRLLGISSTQKCELVFSSDDIAPVKIDLTAKLETFNNLAANNTLCTVHIYSGKAIGVTIEEIPWGEQNYESDI
jgi:hypothetical protein